MLACQASCLGTGLVERLVEGCRLCTLGAQLLLHLGTLPVGFVGLFLHSRPVLLLVRQILLALRQFTLQLLDPKLHLGDLLSLCLFAGLEGFDFSQKLLTPGVQQQFALASDSQFALRDVGLVVKIGAFPVPVAEAGSQFALPLAQMTQSLAERRGSASLCRQAGFEVGGPPAGAIERGLFTSPIVAVRGSLQSFQMGR